MKTYPEGLGVFHGHVLIVDDLANWRETLSEVLSADGQMVYAASDPTEALRIVAEKPIDVAILDLRLEDKDFYDVRGMHLLQEIRKISPRTRVLMMTGFPSDGFLDKVLTVYRVDGFWLKNPVDTPFSIKDFRQEIRLLVEKAKSPSGDGV